MAKEKIIALILLFIVLSSCAVIVLALLGIFNAKSSSTPKNGGV